MHVVVHRPPGKRTRYQTAPLAIPRDASLNLALGVLDPAVGQGPVRFVVEACRADACSRLFEEILDPAGASGAGWQDRRVALASLAGTRDRSLRFTTEHVGAGAFTLPVWGDPTVVAPSSAPERRPNVVLLSIDTLRADHLDLYGYGRETAPYLRDRIAARGVVFERLVAEAATTDPSHMTMFTSLPSLVHGVECCGRGLAVPVVTLAEVLRASGYRTAAFTENGPLDHARGFSLGFDRYVENKSVVRLQPTGQVARTFAQAREWVEGHPDRPFFLFLHTFQVHAPYEPPDRYRAHYLEPPPGEVLPQARSVVDAYDREIRYVDDELALLHGWMEDRGLGADTVWIVLSDHGEEFFEHGSLGHVTLPHETVLRVPLVVQGPGIREGLRDATLLRHLDIMPTVLELVGVEAPHGLLGESFGGILTGRGDPTKRPERPAFSATWVLPQGFETPALSVRLGDAKLIRHRREGREVLALYDLATDPGERRNLAADEPAELERLRTLLDRHERGARDWRRALGDGGAPIDRTLPLDPDREEMLRMLGYIE
jgi:arylsulfatase A-like enzyme